MKGGREVITPCLILGLWVVFSVLSVKGDVFTSVAKLKTLPNIERKLIDACYKYINSQPNDVGLDSFKTFLSIAAAENQAALSDVTYLENPVNAFRFLWRLVDRWQRAIKPICDHSCDHINEKTKGFFKQIGSSITSVSSWPTQDDISGSALAITNLVHTYNLDPDELAKGRLLHTKTTPLAGDELLALAEEVYYQNSVYDARMWLNRSIARLDTMRGQEQLLREAHYRLRDVEEKIDVKLKKNLPVKSDVFYTIYEDGDTETIPDNSKRGKIRGFYQSVYDDLCRHEVKKPSETAHLRCWYKNTSIPFFKVKVELLNSDPYLVIYHDVISDNEIEQIKNVSRPILKRSMLGKSDGSGHEGMKERISQSAWVFDDIKTAARLSRRIHLITGLSTQIRRTRTHAEAFQVLNYGLGGMYEPHEDSVRMYRKLGYETSQTVQDAGDRMATWLFYMSNVTAGGATVFPVINTRVPVIKGAAAFWYNLKRNGRADWRTIHAGCPVLIGDKWVANKWIREVGQTFRRPCSLDPSE